VVLFWCLFRHIIHDSDSWNIPKKTPEQESPKKEIRDADNGTLLLLLSCCWCFCCLSAAVEIAKEVFWRKKIRFAGRGAIPFFGYYLVVNIVHAIPTRILLTHPSTKRQRSFGMWNNEMFDSLDQVLATNLILS
jgi:hypothetical protein